MMCDDIIKPDFTIAEIGSFGGVSSEVLALHCQKLYCVDTWEDWSGDGFIYTAMERFDNMKSLYRITSYNVCYTKLLRILIFFNCPTTVRVSCY